LESVYRETYRGFKSLILRSESSLESYFTLTSPGVSLMFTAKDGE
jgi:hypothetical protein